MFHHHKYQYLSKEVTTTETCKVYHMSYMHSTSETVTQEVTLIKRFCTKCGNIDVQTVTGKLTTKDLQVMGY